MVSVASSTFTTTPTTLTSTQDAPQTDVHGLSYPSDFLQSLPVLLPRPAPHEPIRTLSAAQFSQIHLCHLLSHAPDSVLFPFLHGLEGANEDQLSFFWSHGGHSKRTTIPKYRGLIWVACDDEDFDVPQSYQASPICSDDDLDDDDDDFSSSEIECDDEPEIEPFSMDVDTNDNDPPGKDSIGKETSVRMHPVHHRSLSVPESSAPIYAVDYAYSAAHDRRPSDVLSSTSFTSDTSSKAVNTSSEIHGRSNNPPAPPTSLIVPSTSPLLLTSSFRASELLTTGPQGPELVRPRLPAGISLRNFGIQVPIYATLSDIVIYSPKGAARTAFALAEKFKLAIEAKRTERLLANGDDHPEENLLFYNVFVLTATLPEMLESLPHLLSRVQDVRIVGGKTMPIFGSGAYTDGSDAHIRVQEGNDQGTILKANTINFAQREKDEMRDLTKATEILSIPPLPNHMIASSPSTHWDPSLGQIFLGNINDVPIADEWVPSQSYFEDPFDCRSNDPSQGYGYDICIECRDFNYFPTSAHIRAADEHLAILDATWCQRYSKEDGHEIPVRPPPNASSVVHFSFPCSPPSTGGSITALASFISFLDRWLRMPGTEIELIPSARKRGMTFSPSSLPQPSSSFTSRFFAPAASGTYTRLRSTSASYSSHGFPTSYQPKSQATSRTRPMKVLIYSSDGYTESSFLALCLLMAMRGFSLPQAYLELQVAKKRSFFVYQADLGLLKWVEAELCKDRGLPGTSSHPYVNVVEAASEFVCNQDKDTGDSTMVNPVSCSEDGMHANLSRSLTSPVQQQRVGRPYSNGFKRPRANTLPMMPAFADHQFWFNDPRFNGSFPSRVLPFLYLGDLNHASNPYMLHALGITHVVSVGECALVPPPEYTLSSTTPTPNLARGAHESPKEPASLWIEEREGRIKVLDIQGVCDDGIDTLEPQLEPICNWIEKARLEDGHVLVHCRVGVSRSATVTIAYVMKHLGLPLVDAYLIVRSRRLSVLIQPNIRLLYDLQGWEVKLAKERSGDNEEKLKAESARCLNWPYLAREVHTLNEKYLH